MRLLFSPLFILILGFKTLYAQDLLFSIQLTAGINYSVNSYGDVLTFPKIDRKQPGINTGLTIKYFPDQNYVLSIGLEFIESKISGRDKYSNAEWVFRGYPILAGYQYNFLENNNSLYPYISVNISFYLCEVRFNATGIPDDYLYDRYNYKRNESGLGLDGNLGLSYRITEKMEFLTELKLRYNDASLLNRHFSIEFTGIYLNAGVNYEM